MTEERDTTTEVQDGAAAAAPSEPAPAEQPDDCAATPADDLEALAARARERDKYLALAQRTQADFENYRKRMTKEVGVAEARGTAKLAKELLPALDNLGRALDAATPQDEHLAQGIRLVQRDLKAALARLQIEPFSPHGEPFDPNQHEAVAQQPVEGAQPGTVAEVYQEGYRHGETVLRPARVVVAA
jgi:molecular chaperone GrpE